MSALLNDKDDLLHHYAEKAHELATLQRECAPEVSIPSYVKTASSTAADLNPRPVGICDPPGYKEEAPSMTEDEPSEISWPVSFLFPHIRPAD